MTVVGPGAVVQNEISPDATLKGVGAEKIVTVLNPLSDDFAVQVGVSRPVEVPIQVSDPATKGQTKLSELDVSRTYGVGLRNSDHQSNKHFTNQVIIKSGKTMRFTGDVAQVAVRQITNEVLQREGDSKLIADPIKRKAVEDKIIISIQSQEEFMNEPIQTVNDQVAAALKQANEVQHEETAFPELNGAGTSETNSLEEPTVPVEKVDRRPKATSK